MEGIQLKGEEYDNQGSRLQLILKSDVTYRALCDATLICSITALMAAFIALNIVYYFGTNRKCNKKKKYVV